MAFPFMFRFGLQGVGPAVKNLKQVAGGLKNAGNAAGMAGGDFAQAQASLGLLGSTLMGVAGSTVWAAASMEKSMVALDLAFQRVGSSSEAAYQGLARIGLATPGLLEVAGAAAKFGVQGAENLEGFTLQARQMGVVTGKSAKEMGTALVRLSAGLGKTQREMRGVASAMVALERRFPVTIAGMTQLLEKTGALAEVVGLSEGALLGFNAALMTTGVDPGDAQGFMAMLTDNMRLMKGEGIGLSGVFQMMGGSAEEWMAMDLDERALAFADSLGKLSGRGPGGMETAILQLQALGVANANTAVKMLKGFQDMETFRAGVEAGTKAQMEAMALQEEWDKVTETLTGAVGELWRELKVLAITTGKALIPVVTFVVKILETVVWVFNKIPAPIRAAVVALLAVAGAALAVLAALGPFVISIGASMMALQILTPVAATAAGALWGLIAPLLPFIAIAAVVALAGWGLYEMFSALGDSVEEAGGWFNWFNTTVVEPFRNLGENIALFVEGFVEAFTGSAEAARAAGNAVRSFGRTLFEMLIAPFRGFAELVGEVWGGFVGWLETVKLRMTEFINVFKAIGTAIAWPFIKAYEMFKKLSDGIDRFRNAPRKFGERAAEGLKALPGNLWEIAKGMLGIKTGAEEAKAAMRGSSMLHIKEGVAETLPSVQRLGSAFEGLTGILGTVLSAALSAWRIITQPVGAIFGFGAGAGAPATAAVPRARSSEVPAGGVASRMAASPPTSMPKAVAGMLARKGQGGGPQKRVGGAAAAAGDGMAAQAAPTQVRVTTPVTVELDGMVLARALKEHTVEIAEERAWNASSAPLRGVES